MSESDKARLLLALRRARITDTRILAAMEAVPRERFLAAAFADRAYDDVALPIGSGQTMSSPSVVARMTAALAPGERMKVLEIGTGSGYHTAILARLCRRVYTVERRRDLCAAAEERLRSLRIHNVTARVGDGLAGWREQAPFDRILVTAAVESPPPALCAELSDDGALVVPLGPPDDDQRLVRVRRTADGLVVDEIDSVRFIPALEGDPVGARR